MGALDLVAWPALYARLLDTADQVVLERAAWHAERPAADTYGPAALTLAALVCAEGAIGTRVAMFQAGALTVDLPDPLDRHDPILHTADAIAEWLQVTGHLLLGVSAFLADPTQAEPPGPVGGLLVDEALQPLPLLPLARQYAELPWIGGLLVEARPLPPGIAGRYRRRLIELDPQQAHSRQDLEHTWLHELSHALDVNTWHDPEAAERFADHLAALLAWYQPATIAELEPLHDAARDAITASPRHRQPQAQPGQEAPAPQVDGPDLPAPGEASLQAFATLPLLDRAAPDGAGGPGLGSPAATAPFPPLTPEEP
jgi:hypothetical protein